MNRPDVGSTVTTDGYAVIADAVPAAVVDALAVAADHLLAALPPGPRGGVRDLLTVMPAARDLARSPVLRRFVEPVLGPDCVAVGGLLFDKAAGRNWKVPYHQDTTVRVAAKRDDLPGFGPWWEKAGVPHVWPPAAVLERMLAVRVHLDDCGPDNGPLRVIPGSHRTGVLAADDIPGWRDRGTEVACVVGRGGVVLMRPLLLHASSTTATPSRRRVLHIEFAAAGALPAGLEWWEAWPGEVA